MMPFQGNGRYLRDRTVEGLGLLYAMHWPFRQVETARNVRKSSLHDRLAAMKVEFERLKTEQSKPDGGPGDPPA